MSPATFYAPNASPYATTFFSHKCASLSRLLFNLKRDVYVSFINFYSPAVSPPSSLLSCGASVSGAAVSGSGAIMKTPEDAVALSRLIVKVGKILDKSITAVVTSMEEPLGRAVGNSLEVVEAIEFLKGNLDNGDLAEVTYSIAAMTLLQLDLYDNISEASAYLKNLVHSGKALEKFRELIIAQGGAAEVIDNYDKFTLPCYKVECESKKNGYIQNINAHNVSCAVKALGAARENSSKPIDLSVGIFLNKKSGEYVKKGEILYTIYSNNEDATKIAQRYCDEAFSINETRPSHNYLIYIIISTKDEDDNV